MSVALEIFTRGLLLSSTTSTRSPEEALREYETQDPGRARRRNQQGLKPCQACFNEVLKLTVHSKFKGMVRFPSVATSVPASTCTPAL